MEFIDTAFCKSIADFGFEHGFPGKLRWFFRFVSGDLGGVAGKHLVNYGMDGGGLAVFVVFVAIDLCGLDNLFAVQELRFGMVAL